MDPDNQLTFNPLILDGLNLNHPIGSNTMVNSRCLTPDLKSYRSTNDFYGQNFIGSNVTQDYSTIGSSLAQSPNLAGSSSVGVVSPANAHKFLTPKHAQGSYNKSNLNSTDRKNHSFSVESSPANYSGKIQKPDKHSKGLRHFSMKVLQKVQAKGTTTYNEVADELVREFGSKMASGDHQSYDHKNIRRRVYDALNVLMAMNIIHKERKEIKWVGLPSNSLQECQHLENKRDELTASVSQKLLKLRETIIHEVCIRNLVSSNQKNEDTAIEDDSKIEIPFNVIFAPTLSAIQCFVSTQRDDYCFASESKLEFCDEFEIMRKLGYSKKLETGNCTDDDITQIKELLPRTLHPFIEVIARTSAEQYSNLILSLRDSLIPEMMHDTSFNAEASFLSRLIESATELRRKQIHRDIIREEDSDKNDMDHQDSTASGMTEKTA